MTKEDLLTQDTNAFFDEKRKNHFIQDIRDSYRFVREHSLPMSPLLRGLRFTNKELAESDNSSQILAAGYFEYIVNFDLRSKRFQRVLQGESGNAESFAFYQLPLGNVMFGKKKNRFQPRIELDGMYYIDGMSTIIDCKLSTDDNVLDLPKKNFKPKLFRQYMRVFSDHAYTSYNQSYRLFVVTPDGIPKKPKNRFLKTGIPLYYIECGKTYEELMVEAFEFRYRILEGLQ